DNYNISGLNAEEYPILSDLLSYMEDNMPNITNKDTKKYYDNIYRVLNNLVQNYGKIFNGHTSLKDVVSEQIVVFNLQNLTSLKSEIFDAQLFSALSLCWSNAVKIGSTMKRLVEEKKIPVSDVKHFLLLLDESHKTINSTKPYAVEQVLVYAREGRKYFAGIYLASQSIRDFVPEGTSAEGFDKIKTLFELAQYKFILNQDTDAVDMLSNIFKGQLTATEIKKIPRLDRGQAILSISGSKNITFKVEVTPEELMMFKGGV
ncbi:MAG: ATP-binding protein, partial [Ruminococcus sp.]